MATGFVQRWKGKVLAQLLGLGSNGITLYTVSGTPNISPTDLAPLAGQGTVGAASTASNIPNYGVTTVTPATASVNYNLADPFPGRRKTLAVTVASSGARTVTVATTGVTFDGANNKITFSTLAIQTVDLVGISTARWNITGVWPGSTVIAAQPTLSTA